MSTTLHIVVGMSGGVDSSVAALQLLEQGHRVTGLFMKNWDEDDGTEYCTAMQDQADAQQVCDQLGIPLKSVNFATEYWDEVFEHFLKEYAAGRTPNPDILCNREIKFKAFLDYAMDLGADAIATGHYAQIRQTADGYQLLKGLDPNKDQSYFLYTLGQLPLSRSQFPIGGLHKQQVREIAAHAGFKNSSKKDSTGICFIGERKFKDFLQRYLPAQSGEIHTTEGRILGQHDGLMYYTLGQRQGLGIGGQRDADNEPWYVVRKDLNQNRLIVAQGHDHPQLQSSALTAEQIDWVAGHPPADQFQCMAKTRYRQPDQSCTVHVLSEGQIQIEFDQPQRAVTPGQSVVLYDGAVCLGGGVITQTVPTHQPELL